MDTVIRNGLTVFVPRAVQYIAPKPNGDWHASIASKLDGTPALVWVVVICFTPDWTAADADPQMRLVAEFPVSVTKFSEAKAWLSTRTINDLSAAMRTRLQNVYDALGINRSDFTLTTGLLLVIHRMFSAQLEADENFAQGAFTDTT